MGSLNICPQTVHKENGRAIVAEAGTHSKSFTIKSTPLINSVSDEPSGGSSPH